MDSLFTILQNKDFDQPPEVAAIKKYVLGKFNVDVTVKVQGNDITISARSAALVSNLRFDMQNLIKAVATDKRIRLRIG